MQTSTSPPDLPVSIADLVSRDLPMHWSEAVAIVGELCTALTANSPSETAVPDAADIFITSAGAVVLRQGAGRKDDTTTLGYILHELMDASSTSTPLPLRLFVSTSISSNHASVSAFAEALAYYERPGRTELIRAVHERALATLPAETERQSEPVQKDQDQQQEKKEPKPVQPSRRRRSNAVVAGAAAAVLLCAMGAGVWSWMGPQGASSSTALGAVAAQARNAAEKLGATVRETLGIPSGAEQVAEPLATAPSPQKPRRVRRPLRAAASQPLKSSILDALGFSTPLAAVEPTSPLLRETMASQPLMAEDASAPAIRETDVVVVEDSIYSSAAVDVLPPVLLYPHLPPTAPEVRSLPGNSMELLITENGTVERVKLIAGPIRMADMMLLSSAKIWEFRPALKDGRPVRYRLVLNWTMTPR